LGNRNLPTPEHHGLGGYEAWRAAAMLRPLEEMYKMGSASRIPQGVPVRGRFDIGGVGQPSLTDEYGVPGTDGVPGTPELGFNQKVHCAQSLKGAYSRL